MTVKKVELSDRAMEVIRGENGMWGLSNFNEWIEDSNSSKFIFVNIKHLHFEGVKFLDLFNWFCHLPP